MRFIVFFVLCFIEVNSLKISSSWCRKSIISSFNRKKEASFPVDIYDTRKARISQTKIHPLNGRRRCLRCNKVQFLVEYKDSPHNDSPRGDNAKLLADAVILERNLRGTVDNLSYMKPVDRCLRLRSKSNSDIDVELLRCIGPRTFGCLDEILLALTAFFAIISMSMSRDKPKVKILMTKESKASDSFISNEDLDIQKLSKLQKEDLHTVLDN